MGKKLIGKVKRLQFGMKNVPKVAVIIAVVIMFLVLGYLLRIDRFEIFGVSTIDWTDCVKINNEQYHSGFKRTSVDSSSIEKKIGKVKFNVSENVHNSNYFFRNGDATFLDVGTEIFILKSIRNAVAVKIGDQYYLYKAIAFLTELADYYGEYSFSEVSILSGLSSSTIGYMNEQKADNTYTITAELFEIRGADRTISVAMPVYEACALPAENEILALGAGYSALAAQYQIDSAYKVFDADGQKVYRKIFTSSAHPDLAWLADYNDNTATGVEIVVQSVDKILRQSASTSQK